MKTPPEMDREGASPSSQAPTSGRSGPRSEEPTSEESTLQTMRDRFSTGVLPAFAVAALFANLIAGFIGPGWAGVGEESTVLRWRKWSTISGLAAATLGLGALVALVLAAVSNGRTSISTRLVATIGAGLVFAFVSAAFRTPLESTQLIVLFAGAFAVTVAAAVESIGPRSTRALGLQLAVMSLVSLVRVSAWGLAYVRPTNGPISVAWAQRLATGAFLLEVSSLALVVVYLAYRPGFRGIALTVVLLGIGFFLSSWILGTTYQHAGTFRDALQRAFSMRVQSGGPPPSWVDPQQSLFELAILERAVRMTLLPLLLVEISSIALSLASLGSSSRTTMRLLAAMALVTMSRGQSDTPLRALEFTVAAMCALVLSRAARRGERNSLVPSSR